MSLVDSLLGEHAVIERLLERLTTELSAETPVDRLRIKVEALAAILAPHADLEDELLFDPVAAQPGETPALLVQMAAEHQGVRRRLTEWLGEPTADGLSEILAGIRAHFRTEEREGFALAVSRLDDQFLAERRELYLEQTGRAR